MYGTNIDSRARLSLRCIIDKTNPSGIYIGEYSFVARGAMILAHDYSRRRRMDTRIGNYCFIGVNSVVLPGVNIGNHCIIGAGAIVTKDVPDNCIVAGNPARIIKENIGTTKYGQIV
jgi:acetyltransferase-like isoleucine patch superfamily enzyme